MDDHWTNASDRADRPLRAAGVGGLERAGLSVRLQGCAGVLRSCASRGDGRARELVVIHAPVLRDVASHWHPHGSGAADRIIPRCAVSRVRSRHSFSGQDRSAQLKVWVANAKAKEQLETSLEAARADFKSAKAAAKAHLESYRLMVERSRWSRLGRLLGIGPTARRPWRWTASELVRYREQSSAAFDRQHRTAR